MLKTKERSKNSNSTRVVARIGHAHLHVRELKPAVQFYRQMIGLKLIEEVKERFAFLSAGHHHHDLALQAIGKEAPDAVPYSPGLYHVAFQADNAGDFLVIWDRLIDGGVRFTAVDHGISWAIYFDDPDGNGVEVYLDRRSAPEGSFLWKGRSAVLSYQRVEAEAGRV